MSFQIPYANSFYYDQSGANSIYNALQVRLVHRFTKGVSFQAFYTFAKSLDNASTIGGSAPVVVQQDGNYAAERGLSSFDVRHQVRVFSVYELPFGEHHRYGNHGWAEHVLSNWRLQNIVTWQTGTPVTAYLGGTAADNGTGASFSLRAEQIGDPNVGICGGSPLALLQYRRFHHARRRRTTATSAAAQSKVPANSIGTRRSRNPSASARKSGIIWISAGKFRIFRTRRVSRGFPPRSGSSSFGRVTSAGSMRTMDVMARFNL